jgi:flagellar assembly protein FliH
VERKSLSKKILKKVQAQYLSYNLEELNMQTQKSIGIALNETKQEAEEEKDGFTFTQEDIERIKRSAYQEGFSKGYEEGKKLGFEEGFREGFSEGKEKGYEEGKAKAQSELEEERARLKNLLEAEGARLKNLIDKLDKEAQALVLNLDKEILDLACLIAERVLFTKPKVDEEALLNLIRECLKFVAEGLKVKVRINPVDLNLIKDHLDELPPTYHLEFEEDPSLSPGGIILSSATGLIDATLETRIRQVIAKLKDEN